MNLNGRATVVDKRLVGTTVAMRVLAQPCSALRAERVWSSYGRVHTDARNRMSKDWAKKLKG